MLKIEHKIADFLKENVKELVHNWEQNIMLDGHDQNLSLIVKNGVMMYNIIQEYLVNPNNFDDKVQPLAKKVAQERVEIQANMGTFVYNVNIGRSEIFKHLYKLDLSMSELQLGVNKMNYAFDQFLYYSVTFYTEFMNKKLEEKNRYIVQSHNDRLTILGQMTSSFVHEFRNPLTSITGFVQLLKGDAPETPYIDIIQQELMQLNNRISQFLVLSRKEPKDQFKFISVNELITETIDFVYPSIVDKGIRLLTNMETDVTLEANRTELKQVFVNIIFNSIEALEYISKSKKTIIISLEKTCKDILIRISNNGPKIPEYTLNTIFDPFVTTKDTGTGLGLFVCKEIIERHSGIISCKSNDEMTTFTMELDMHTI